MSNLQHFAKTPATRIDSMEVYESPFQSRMSGELFQSSLRFDDYLNVPEIIDKYPYPVTVTVAYRSGEQYCWETKYLEVGYVRQFGVAVTADGNSVFAQTWENGLYCLDARTGDKRWRTKSRRGVTNVFVGKDYILCQQHNRALQLLDIQTGEVLSERRVTLWGFTSLNLRYIACEARVARWEFI